MLQILSPNSVLRCSHSAHTDFAEHVVQRAETTEDLQVDIAEALDKEPGLGGKEQESSTTMLLTEQEA